MLRSNLFKLTVAMALVAAVRFSSAAGVDSFVSPSGGELYQVGQKQQVRVSRGSFKSDVLIELSVDGGKNFTSLGTITAPNKTTKDFLLDFTVPASPSASAIMRASSSASKTPISILSRPFTITSGDLSAGTQIAASSVNSTALADGSVTTAKLADGSVTTAKLADSAVTTAKLGAKSATPDKLNSGPASAGFVATSDGTGGVAYLPVAANNIATGAVTNASVAANAAIAYQKLNLANSIQSSDIKDGTIVDADVAVKGITYSKLDLTNGIVGADIRTGQITDVHVAAGAGIQYSKLTLFNSITNADIKTGTITDSNVSDTAGIQYQKLNLANSILNTDIVNGTIGLNKISTTGATAGQVITFDGTNLVYGAGGGGGGGFTVPVSKTASSNTPLLALNNTGDALAGSFTINNPAAVSDALAGFTSGSGAGVLGLSTSGVAVTGRKSGNDIGSAGIFENTNAANLADMLIGRTTGAGSGVVGISSNGIAVEGRKSGTEIGNVGKFANTNAANTSAALIASTTGSGPAINANSSLGSAGIFENSNAGNALETLIARSNATAGTVLRTTSSGNAVAAIFESTGTGVANTINVTHAGTGNAISVLQSNAASTNDAVVSTNNGSGDGLVGVSAGGFGVTGIANSAAGVGTYGQNYVGGSGVFADAQAANRGATLSINRAAGGAGTLSLCFGNNGYGVYSYCGTDINGVANTTNVAGHFENRNPNNTLNTLEASTVSAAPALSVSSLSTLSAGVALQLTATAGVNSAALKVTSGGIALSQSNNYAGGSVDNSYLIVTTAGNVTIPITPTLADGTTIWVVNNTNPAAQITVTNLTTGGLVVTPGTAKHFLYIKAVSNINWIPVQ